MPTQKKPEIFPRSVVLNEDENKKMIGLRGFYELQTGKTHTMSDVIRKAIVATAEANGL